MGVIVDMLDGQAIWDHTGTTFTSDCGELVFAVLEQMFGNELADLATSLVIVRKMSVIDMIFIDKVPYSNNRNFFDMILEAMWLLARILLCHDELCLGTLTPTLTALEVKQIKTPQIKHDVTFNFDFLQLI